MTLAHSELLRRLHYDPETGVWTWRVTVSNATAGSDAGCVTRHNHGRCFYRVIGIDGKLYLAHRLAFFYMTGAWPTLDIDHKDGDGLNNRWANLREATVSQNLANARRHADNISGFKGVTFDKPTKKFRAQIMINYKQIYLGLHATPEAAHDAYRVAAEKHSGNFARMK